MEIDVDREASDAGGLETAFRNRFHSVNGGVERRTIAVLAHELAGLPIDRALAVLETSGTIAGVSLRASIEFLRAAPGVSPLLQAGEIRAWGDLGRRMAMGDVESAVSFFRAGTNDVGKLPQDARSLLFLICSRQVELSISTAIDTYHRAFQLAEKVKDAKLLTEIFEAAAQISRRSVKHSALFLKDSPSVVESFQKFGVASTEIARASTSLAQAFAVRAGGGAADAWSAIPASLAGLEPGDARRLLGQAVGFLERGGGAALQVLVSGGEVLRTLPQIFDAWIDLLWSVSAHGNASLVAFVRIGPVLFRSIYSDMGDQAAVDLSLRIISVTREIGVADPEAALACFRSSASALKSVSWEQFEQWARDGLSFSKNNPRARRSYYALETRRSRDALRNGGVGLSLETVQQTLRLYIEGLTGTEVEIAALAAVPREFRIGDGRTVFLPSTVSEFQDEALNFSLYKVLAAHGAGQIEFGTYAKGSDDLRDAFSVISETYSSGNKDAFDAFALNGYINTFEESEPAVAPVEEARMQAGNLRRFPSGGDYVSVLELFPLAGLAKRIFGTLENCRIDRQLRIKYRGLVRDLDLTRKYLKQGRPRILELPQSLVPFEILFQIALCGGVADDASQFYGQVVLEFETIVSDYLSRPGATVADTLMATSRVYSLFQSVTQDNEESSSHVGGESFDGKEELGAQHESSRTPRAVERIPQKRDVRDLFNAWNSTDDLSDPDELDGAEEWTLVETPEQGLAVGELAYSYDEWDRELGDHRLGWCRVIEKQVRRGDRSFVARTRENYKGVISSVRRQFQLMKPEQLARVTNELDGDDYNLGAVIDYVIDRRADGHQSERIYTKRLRQQRDVAVSFLLDQSSSTARTMGRHPLQPYTHPGRRIIEIEKEGLVLMSEALEAVGDAYSIYGFTSEGRRNVKFFVVKDFQERYSEEVELRIGGITYQNNTRLGAAIRHAAFRLARQEARTRLLIVLSDGRPYDHDYGDARYAREDTREALSQAKNQGITPFCITIDRESESELRDLYGEVGYTIIDDVVSLPERMPGIYRRLTT